LTLEYNSILRLKFMESKTALIIGSTSAIGRVTVKVLGKAGFNLILSRRNDYVENNNVNY
jgi:NAD(P)-dependent dehydrogenase (short-subunit alcohol dehydrogenase family)